jgi:hypothetical protein
MPSQPRSDRVVTPLQRVHPQLDNGWIGLYINPPMDQLWDEMETHPNIPYKPFGAGSYAQIPAAYR